MYLSVVTPASGLTQGPEMTTAKYPHHLISLSRLLVSVITSRAVMIANVSAKSILESQWISDIPTLWAGRGGISEGKRLSSELSEKKSEMFFVLLFLDAIASLHLIIGLSCSLVL